MMLSVARWIFGYGSLVWRPAFPHIERRPAMLRGFARRFWQGSTDHRGVPGAPGRVVTLVRDDAAECVGVAYRVAPSDWENVIAQLDHREQGGYEQLEAQLALLGERREVPGLVYVAGPANPEYLGPAPTSDIAAQIAGAEGPSGRNVEYVLRLEEALRGMDADDPHVFELAALLRRMKPHR